MKIFSKRQRIARKTYLNTRASVGLFGPRVSATVSRKRSSVGASVSPTGVRPIVRHRGRKVV